MWRAWTTVSCLKMMRPWTVNKNVVLMIHRTHVSLVASSTQLDAPKYVEVISSASWDVTEEVHKEVYKMRSTLKLKKSQFLKLQNAHQNVAKTSRACTFVSMVMKMRPTPKRESADKPVVPTLWYQTHRAHVLLVACSRKVDALLNVDVVSHACWTVSLLKKRKILSCSSDKDE